MRKALKQRVARPMDVNATLEQRVAALEDEVIYLRQDMNDLDDVTLKNWTEDISGMNLNSLVGITVIGYGNSCTNKPTGAGNGWLINLPHSDEDLAEKYNKQLWIERTNNHVWMRRMENDTWGSWEQLH